jgi:hypothetical protein
MGKDGTTALKELKKRKPELDASTFEVAEYSSAPAVHRASAAPISELD